jgi:hypothetical protein
MVRFLLRAYCLLMFQRRKHGQVLVMCLLFGNVHLLCELQYKRVAPNEFPSGSQFRTPSGMWLLMFFINLGTQLPECIFSLWPQYKYFLGLV